jgi:hypothetical protein
MVCVLLDLSRIQACVSYGIKKPFWMTRAHSRASALCGVDVSTLSLFHPAPSVESMAINFKSCSLRQSARTPNKQHPNHRIPRLMAHYGLREAFAKVFHGRFLRLQCFHLPPCADGYTADRHTGAGDAQEPSADGCATKVSERVTDTDVAEFQNLLYCSIVLLSSICKRRTSSCRMIACSSPAVMRYSSAAGHTVESTPTRESPPAAAHGGCMPCFVVRDPTAHTHTHTNNHTHIHTHTHTHRRKSCAESCWHWCSESCSGLSRTCPCAAEQSVLHTAIGALHTSNDAHSGCTESRKQHHPPRRHGIRCPLRAFAHLLPHAR